MPELVEVEYYRSLVEARALGRGIVGVGTPDAWYLKGGLSPIQLQVLAGAHFTGARRRGKLLLLDTSFAGDGCAAGDDAGAAGPVLGLRFGMTGRLLVDGSANVERLLYSPVGDQPSYRRFWVDFADGGQLAVSDPRRLGGVSLDPDEDRLGPDAMDAGPAAVAGALAGSRAPLKARIMDQQRLAGVGNLIADEVLWRAGLAPGRPAGALSPAETRRLARHLGTTLADLLERGGTHTGDLLAERHAGGVCPKDGAPLARSVVGGRTTWWCPHHQR